VLGIEQITYRKEISEKNKDISDNIEYSKRIQGAIMPPESLMQTLIPDSFIIFKQRDVIGGDFYWCEQIGTKIFVAIGDCTGHGVSGALMSILCSNIITQAVKVHNMFDTGLILDFLNQRIKESLHQYDGRQELVLDGLDVSLLVIDLKYNVLMFSGAMHNLYLVRGNQLTEIKGNRIPIGGIAHEMTNKFTTQMHLLYPDLRIYMSTDGYFDQFNGSTIRKFSKSRFKKMVIELDGMPMAKQKGMLWKKHIEWKGGASQTDDICVFACSLRKLLPAADQNK
jgi:serine phosphatase RsbU (regulator of sigma subunit)